MVYPSFHLYPLIHVTFFFSLFAVYTKCSILFINNDRKECIYPTLLLGLVEYFSLITCRYAILLFWCFSFFFSLSHTTDWLKIKNLNFGSFPIESITNLRSMLSFIPVGCLHYYKGKQWNYFVKRNIDFFIIPLRTRGWLPPFLLLIWKFIKLCVLRSLGSLVTQ